MTLKQLAKKISAMRINSADNCLFFNIDIYRDNKCVESFYCEGVYNHPTIGEDEFYNYYLPFFDELWINEPGYDGHDDFFTIEEDTAIEAARSFNNAFKHRQLMRNEYPAKNLNECKIIITTKERG